MKYQPNTYQNVLNLVKTGLNISTALKQLHVSSNALYMHMTPFQKRELYAESRACTVKTNKSHRSSYSVFNFEEECFN